MFERRLKIILLILVSLTTLLVLRAFQVQVLQKKHWTEQAVETMKHEQLIDTTRGRLLDRRGREIAVDAPCNDVAVDYRAIVEPPDEEWVKDLARQRLRSNRLSEWKSADNAGKRQLLADETEHVKTDIKIMWATLSKLGSQTPEQIADVRESIIRKVEMRRRYVWYAKFQDAMEAHDNSSKEPSSWWRQWLIDDTRSAPELNDYEVEVAEQRSPHVILPNISNDVYGALWKNLDQYPGLVLQPSTTRQYPYASIASHLVGYLAKVNKKEREDDPYLNNPLRRYWFNDLIGRGGLEKLCEPALRGTRGREEEDMINDERRRTNDPTPGIDVRSTVDMDLEKQVADLFSHVPVLNPDNTTFDYVPMHGGAVVIDVQSGDVLAMVSVPQYDPNTLGDQFAQLALDDVNKPMLNRATQYALVPGSTIKTVVGLGGITQGKIGVNEGIECTGYLIINGKRFAQGRCWTASKYQRQLYDPSVAHHQIPLPHHGHDGNQDGWLTYSDALERSCNVYFETVASRLGMQGLSYWFKQFGLGDPSGCGIEEVSGTLPEDFDGPAYLRQSTTWFAGIGQGQISATPVQMANVAATIARRGVWMRPKLVATGGLDLNYNGVPERRDLHLPPTAVDAAWKGMYNVANSPAGTGTKLVFDEYNHKYPLFKTLSVCGKTGTAQAAKYTVMERDADGKPLKDENTGRVRHRALVLSTHDNPNPENPWYRGSGKSGTDLAHAWYIGFAPAHKPQVAFAVMVEYGGSGGIGAASVARGTLEALVQHGYLAPDGGGGGSDVADSAAMAPSAPEEEDATTTTTTAAAAVDSTGADPSRELLEPLR